MTFVFVDDVESKARRFEFPQAGLLLALVFFSQTACSLVFESSASPTVDAGQETSDSALGCPAERPISTGRSCVQCLASTDCQAPTPACELGAGTCVECLSDADCPSAACDVRKRECVPEGNVVYVSEEGAGAVCTLLEPCALNGGVLALQDAEDLREVLSLSGSFTRNLVLQPGTAPTLVLGYGASLKPYDENTPALRVKQITTEVQGLRLHGAKPLVDGTFNSADGVALSSGSSVTLYQVLLEENEDEGVDTFESTLTLLQSVIRFNRGGSIEIQDSNFLIQNNFIVQNTGGVGGIHLINSVAKDQALYFNTIANNTSTSTNQQGTGINCRESATPLVAYGNIFYGGLGGPVFSGDATCTHLYSNIRDLPVDEQINGNISADPLFMLGANEFHLQAEGPGRDIDFPGFFDLNVNADIDNEARPKGDGPDMGADEI